MAIADNLEQKRQGNVNAFTRKKKKEDGFCTRWIYRIFILNRPIFRAVKIFK